MELVLGCKDHARREGVGLGVPHCARVLSLMHLERPCLFGEGTGGGATRGELEGEAQRNRGQ